MLEIACPAQGGKAKITVEMSSKNNNSPFRLKNIKLNQL